jgi:hypothetical protein
MHLVLYVRNEEALIEHSCCPGKEAQWLLLGKHLCFFALTAELHALFYGIPLFLERITDRLECLAIISSKMNKVSQAW